MGYPGLTSPFHLGYTYTFLRSHFLLGVYIALRPPSHSLVLHFGYDHAAEKLSHSPPPRSQNVCPVTLWGSEAVSPVPALSEISYPVESLMLRYPDGQPYCRHQHRERFLSLCRASSCPPAHPLLLLHRDADPDRHAPYFAIDASETDQPESAL